MDRADDLPNQAPQTFADRLNYLFETHLSPLGRPYTLRQVSDGMNGKLSVAYLSLLRKGGVEMPRGDKVQALADFFNVDVSYFLGNRADSGRSQEEDMHRQLEQALSKPLVREVALRAGEVGEAERALILDLLERAHQRALEARARRTEAPSVKPEPQDDGTGID